MMKHLSLKLMSIFVMMVSVCIGFASCGDDDDGSDGASLTADDLVGRSFYYTRDNIETIHYNVEFHNAMFAHVHIWGSGIDKDGTYRWDNGEEDCSFTVSGGSVTIVFKTSKHDETFSIPFSGKTPTGGWKEGPGVSTDGIGGSDTSAGTAAMAGWYTSEDMHGYIDKSCNELVYSANGEKSWWDDMISTYSNFYGWRIVDSNTIWKVYDRVSLSRVTGSDVVNYDSKTYSVAGKTYTVYSYFVNYAEETYKYAMKGSQIILTSSNTSMEYNDGKLYVNGQPFKKVK